ncbi:amidase [Cupriavidus sp. CP313]
MSASLTPRYVFENTLSEDTQMEYPSVALTERQLAQAGRLNTQLNALISIRREHAIADARRADLALARGSSLGLLHGITFTIKDNIDIAGEPTSAGASFLAGNIAVADAPVVARLRRAGAVIIGKANMAELAFGSRSYSPVGGQCRNPWNPEYIPGGSSGGSAVSVATDMCIGSLGTDTGGSVRHPAAATGVSGLRPTVGRVPTRGVIPVDRHSDTVGPLARSVTDVARIFAVIAGFDADDPGSIDMPLSNFLPSIQDGIAGRRIGIPRNHYFENVEYEIAEAVMAAARRLEEAGAVLVDIEVPMVSEAHVHQSRASLAGIASVHFERMMAEPQTITAALLERMRHGLNVTGVEYAEAMTFASRFRAALRALFSHVDLLLSPTVRTSPALIEDGASLLNATNATTLNTYPGSLAGIPGLSIPCGFTSAGLPIGLQLEGPWWHEPLLFQAGVTFQQATDFHLHRPPLS